MRLLIILLIIIFSVFLDYYFSLFITYDKINEINEIIITNIINYKNVVCYSYYYKNKNNYIELYDLFNNTIINVQDIRTYCI